MNDKPLHPLTLLLRSAYFNRYGSCGASIPYESLEHFSSLIYRRWGYWPEQLLQPIFERFETAQESSIEAAGKFVAWVDEQIKLDVDFKEFVPGLREKQTLDELIFDAAIEQARGSPNEHFHWAIWKAAENLPDKDKQRAKQESIQCQQDETFLLQISSSSKSLIGPSAKNGRAETKFTP